MRFTKKLLFAFMLLFIFSCNKDDEGAMQEENLAELITNEVTDINLYSVTTGGKLVNSGDSEVSEVGFVIGVTSAPRVENHLHKYIVTQNQAGEFTKTITGLNANTTYYLRSYAINTEGIGYGNEIEFRTPEENVFVGDVILRTQEEVEEFGANNYTTIDGFLQILNFVTDLNPLESLVIVKNGFGVGYTDFLQNLEGLNNIKSIGNNTSSGLYIEYNDALENFSGLNNLEIINGDVFVAQNSALLNFDGLNNVETISGELIIKKNDSLQTLSGLDSLVSIESILSLFYNLLLSDISALSNLTNVESLYIYQHRNLESLTGLENIESLYELAIGSNNNLINIDSFRNLSTITGYLSILNNNDLLEITGFQNLVSAKRVFIDDNDSLTRIDAFENLGPVDDIFIKKNQNLTSLPSLNQLVSKALYIIENYSLENFVGLGSFSAKEIVIRDNYSLRNFQGFENINFTSLEKLYIEENSNLISLQGLEGLETIQKFYIKNNISLLNLNGLNNLRHQNSEANRIDIEGNINLISIEGLENLMQIDGSLFINIYNQPNLLDLCVLKPLLQTGFFRLLCGNTLNYCPDLIEDILTNCP